jgi:hypothetical protein
MILTVVNLLRPTSSILTEYSVNTVSMKFMMCAYRWELETRVPTLIVSVTRDTISDNWLTASREF